MMPDLLKEWPNCSGLADLFRLAHLKTFGHDASPYNFQKEVAVYKANSILPPYVRQYLKQLGL